MENKTVVISFRVSRDVMTALEKEAAQRGITDEDGKPAINRTARALMFEAMGEGSNDEDR